MCIGAGGDTFYFNVKADAAKLTAEMEVKRLQKQLDLAQREAKASALKLEAAEKGALDRFSNCTCDISQIFVFFWLWALFYYVWE